MNGLIPASGASDARFDEVLALIRDARQQAVQAEHPAPDLYQLNPFLTFLKNSSLFS